MIRILSTFEELIQFKPQWDSLFQKDKNATPFQQFGYILASLSLNEDEKEALHIIAVKEDSINSWIAIFPFYLDKNKTLKFLNSRHTDFCAPIIDTEFAHYSLYKEVSEYIERSKYISGLCLDNVERTSPLLSVLKPFFRYMISHDFNFYSKIEIYTSEGDKDFVDSFRYVQSKQRRNLRKKNNLINQECDFKILSASAGNPYPKDKVDYLVSNMLSSGIRAKEYFSEKMLNFWEELYRSNILSIAIISSGANIKALNFMYFDAKKNEYIKWLMLYEDSSWNMAINIKIAEYIYLNRPGTTINFARGIYDYKLVNFHPDVYPLFRVMIAKSRWGHFKNIISTAFHYSKPIIKSFLRR